MLGRLANIKSIAHWDKYNFHLQLYYRADTVRAYLRKKYRRKKKQNTENILWFIRRVYNINSFLYIFLFLSHSLIFCTMHKSIFIDLMQGYAICMWLMYYYPVRVLYVCLSLCTCKNCHIVQTSFYENIDIIHCLFNKSKS